MVSLRNFILFPAIVTALSTLQRRDPSLIISDIQGIDTNVNSLRGKTTSWNGGIIESGPILTGILAVHVANRKGYADALVSPSFSSADSNAIISYANQTLVVDIPAAVQATISKKAQFAAIGMTGLVRSSLVLLKNDHDSFSAALTAKLSADTVARGAVVVKSIDDAIQSGIDAFS